MSSGAVLYPHGAGATIDGAPSIADGQVLYPATNRGLTVVSPSTSAGNTVTVTTPGSQSSTVGTAVSQRLGLGPDTHL